MDTRVVRRRIEIEKDGKEELCHGPQVVEEMQQLSLFSNATAQSTGGPQHAQPLKLHIHTAEGEERETASQSRQRLLQLTTFYSNARGSVSFIEGNANE